MYHKGYKNLLGANFSTSKLILFLGLGVLLLFSPKIASAQWTDNFDSYSIGDFKFQSDWNVAITSTIYVSGNAFKSYPQSLYFATNSNMEQARMRNQHSATTVAKGSFKFYWKIGNIDHYFYVRAWDYASNSAFQITLDNQNATEYDIILNVLTGHTLATGYYPDPIFHSIEVQWDYSGTTSEHKVRAKLDNGFWSIWFQGGSLADGVREIMFETDLNYVDTDYYWFDSFSTEEYYGICGTGQDCVYCYDKTNCENQGCYWLEMIYAGACLETSPPLATTTSDFSWTNYYASNSEFSTPLVLTNRLVSSSEPILLILSSWLENFSDLFDISEAQGNGVKMGQAVPRARGYLDFFNALFADLPVSEILLIYLIIIVGIIIFRIIRQIKKLIAF